MTDHTARDLYPRFSPAGKWIAFSSNRYGNNDVFVISAAGGPAKQLTFHSGNDEVVGWTRDGTSVVFRAARGAGAFPNTVTLHQIAIEGGQEQPLPTDWGWSGSFSPDGKSLVFNRHPSTWSRRHYRGSSAADLWITNLAGERYNRYWPMWGADDAIYFVGDPLPHAGHRRLDRHRGKHGELRRAAGYLRRQYAVGFPQGPRRSAREGD